MSDIRDPSDADLLVDLADQDFEFARTAEGDPFAVARTGPRIIVPMMQRDSAFHDALLLKFQDRYKRIAAQSEINRAVRFLRARTSQEDRAKVFLRVGCDKDQVVVDLGRADGKVVVITRDGWHTGDASAVLFRRSALIGEMPLPDDSGTLDDVRAVLQIDDDVERLIVPWLVAFFMERIAQPIMLLTGEAGSGKSTLAQRIVQILNPTPVRTQGEPRKFEDWIRVFGSSPIVAIDNVRRPDNRVSDLLCRAVTGDGQVKRQLYRDTDIVVTEYRRAIILNGIDLGELEPDLVDRLVLAPLRYIRNENRRTERELIFELDDRRPKVLGAIFSLLSQVLAKLPDVELRERPRMADYAEVVAAVDLVLNTGGTYLAAYLGNREVLASDLLDGNAVAQFVIAFMREGKTWRGTNGELLEEMNARGGIDRSQLPKNPRALRSQLNRLAPALRRVGIEIAFPSGKGSSLTRRQMTITRRVGLAATPSTPSTSSAPSAESAEGHASSEADTGAEDATSRDRQPSTPASVATT